jgi:hypothetical protein
MANCRNSLNATKCLQKLLKKGHLLDSPWNHVLLTSSRVEFFFNYKVIEKMHSLICIHCKAMQGSVQDMYAGHIYRQRQQKYSDQKVFFNFP